MQLSKVLSYNYAFRGVPEGAIAFLAAMADVRRFDGGTPLVRQFDRCRDLYLILEGEAVTRTFNGDVVARFGPGSLVGEMSLLDGDTRSATVTCVGHVKVAILRAWHVDSVMESDPEVAKTILQNLSKVLCRRLRTMNDQLESIPQRVSVA